nr:hypothetical protein [Phytohabitans suffuscus]
MVIDVGASMSARTGMLPAFATASWPALETAKVMNSAAMNGCGQFAIRAK